MSNERFWREVAVDQSLGSREYSIPWEEQELRLDALDNTHPWFRELSPFGGKILDPFILIRLAPQLVREAFPERGGGVYSKYELELLGPVRWDSRITVTGRVADKYEKRGGKYVAFEVSFLDEGERPIMRVKFHTLTNVAEKVASRKGGH